MNSRSKSIRVVVCAFAVLAVVGCATRAPAPVDATSPRVDLTLLHGWYDGRSVDYVTTDVSDAEVARAKGANFAPLLAHTVPTAASRTAGVRGATARVYAIVDAVQGPVFATAPQPIGPANAGIGYTPLWQMVKVRWADKAAAVVLRSEEAVLAAEQSGAVRLEITNVVLNCPIVGDTR